MLDSLHPLTLIESPQYEWDSFLAELGGTLGIWLGITWITFLEFIDLSITTILLCYSRVVRKSKKEQTNPEIAAGTIHTDSFALA